MIESIMRWSIEMSIVKELHKKYAVKANIADQLHKYPDEIWDLLSRWYYHQSINIDYDQVDPADVEPGILVDIKQKYGTEDAEKALEKCAQDHDAKADKIADEVSRKYPEVKDLFETVLESSLADKFEKWMHTNKVYNPLGEPRVKYLDH